MRFQDYMIDAIRNAIDEAFKYAKAIPPDKLSWKPLDLGRSALDQIQELAQCADFVTGMLTGDKEEPSEDRYMQMLAERQQWTTIEECEKQAQVRLERLFAAIKGFPDEKLTSTVWLPYDGGRDFTMMEVMEYPRWNSNYHAGQIAYIQTLYGDTEMH